MNTLLQGMLSSVAFVVLGAIMLVAAYLVTDLLTPGKLRHQIFLERNRNAAIFLSSTIVGIAAIIFTAISTTYEDLLKGLAATSVFGALGLLLMTAGFWLIDVVTPGRLGEIVVDPQPHPAVWVSSTMNLAVAAIVCASIL